VNAEHAIDKIMVRYRFPKKAQKHLSAKRIND